MENPRIALVQDWLTTFRGGEQVLLALHNLYPEAPIYTSIHNPAKTPQFAQADIRTSYLQRIPGAKKRFETLIPLMPFAFESFDLKEYDIVISVGNGLSKGVVTHPHQRHIWYCHTPARYLWKMGGDNRNQGKADSGLRAWAEHHLRVWDVASSTRPDVLVANSKNTVSRIAKIYRRDSEVIYPPVDTERFLSTKDKLGDYFLTVSQHVAYKRVDLVIAACIAAKKKLKVVGEGPESPALKKLANGSKYIEFLGRVSLEELQHLYAHTQAFIFAAEEDLGIVPIEAMSAGRPILAFGKGGARETVQAGITGEFFMEQSAEALTEALKEFDPKKYDSKDICKHAETFGVEAFNKGIRALVERESALLQ